MRFKALLMISTTCLCSCATTTYRGGFESTVKEIDRAKTTCLKYVSDSPSAERECFPLLTRKRLLIRVEKINSDYGTTVSGNAGNDRSLVECRLEKKVAEKVMATPGLIKPGSDHWVSGVFSSFGSSTYFDRYELSKCEIEGIAH